MSEPKRKFEAEVFSLGPVDLEILTKIDTEPRSDEKAFPKVLPVSYSLEVIQKLIERLQEL